MCQARIELGYIGAEVGQRSGETVLEAVRRVIRAKAPPLMRVVDIADATAALRAENTRLEDALAAAKAKLAQVFEVGDCCVLGCPCPRYSAPDSAT